MVSRELDGKAVQINSVKILLTLFIIVALLVWRTANQSCNIDTLNNARRAINKTFIYNYPIKADVHVLEELVCTANDQNSIVTNLYLCVNGTPMQINDCDMYHSTSLGRASSKCLIAIEVENASYSYYCTETRLGNPTAQLSLHYNISVILGTVTFEYLATTFGTDYLTDEYNFTTKESLTTNSKNPEPDGNGAGTVNKQVPLVIALLIFPLLTN